MRQFLLFSSSRLAQLSALDIRAEKALDVDLPIEEILGDFLALFVAVVRRQSQTLFYVVRREELGQSVVSLYKIVVSGFQRSHRFYLTRHISLQLSQLGFFGYVSFCGETQTT